MESMSLIVLTPEQKVSYEGVEYISLPSREGEVGVLPGHADTVIALDKGTVVYKKNGKEESIMIESGFVQISYKAVSILTEKLIVV